MSILFFYMLTVMQHSEIGPWLGFFIAYKWESSDFLSLIKITGRQSMVIIVYHFEKNGESFPYRCTMKPD